MTVQPKRLQVHPLELIEGTSSPPPTHHGVSKGLMTAKGPIILGSVQRLVTHKDYVIEMVSSIIKETNMDMCMDMCGEHTIEDLGAFDLFDLLRLAMKLAMLEKENHRHEELEKANTNLTTELAALYKQMEKTQAEAVAAFQTTQLYYDECSDYYGDGFDDCLKQVDSVFPDLDLS
nr:hypothetical protein CFP56_13596 [Quercus suber]